MELELKLPLLGDVMTEGKLVEWLQDDGAHVHKGVPLYQLETDKVSYTVEAPQDGVLERLIDPGETVAVGTVVGRLRDAASVVAPSSESPRSGARVAGEMASTEGGDQRITPAARRLAKQLGVDVSQLPRDRRLREADVQAFHDAARGTAATEDVQATPAARRLARQLGVDLALAGAGRLIREADVRALSGHRPDAGSSLRVPAAAGTPLAGRRKIIAERMHRSLQEMAQLTISLEVDMTEALRMRQQLKELWAESGPPTITDLVIRASVLALAEHPRMNATLEDSTVSVRQEINIGLAVDDEAGLIVPVIPDAGRLGLKQLAGRTKDAGARAREGKVSPDELQGGTFTLTNLGTLGIDFFTPIVNPPQVAILGVGRVFSKLALKDGEIEERSSMYLNLSFDHRAVDGAPAARFLGAVKRFLELPVSLVA